MTNHPNRKKITVSFTVAQIEAVRWMANMGMSGAESIPEPTLAACRRGLEAMVTAMGHTPYLRAGGVYVEKDAHRE